MQQRQLARKPGSWGRVLRNLFTFFAGGKLSPRRHSLSNTAALCLVNRCAKVSTVAAPAHNQTRNNSRRSSLFLFRLSFGGGHRNRALPVHVNNTPPVPLSLSFSLFRQVSNKMGSGEWVYLCVQDLQTGHVITLHDNRALLMAQAQAGSDEEKNAFRKMLGQ